MMVSRNVFVRSLEEALNTVVHFKPDSQDSAWFRGQANGYELYIRMGNFPDEELYSLYLGAGRWMDFTVPPSNWTIQAGPFSPGVRPKLPKGEFYE